MGKADRIRRLLPLFEQSRIILPPTCFKTLFDRSTVDLVGAFVVRNALKRSALADQR
jgi:hypothetical protein